jgi:hypothetical protein
MFFVHGFMNYFQSFLKKCLTKCCFLFNVVLPLYQQKEIRLNLT